VTDRTPTPTIAWGGATDTGRVRSENEDSFFTEPMAFVVADGMGGHQAGEVASAIAVTTLRNRLSGGAVSVDVAVAAVMEANAAIFQGAHNNLDQRGMGTTVVGLVVLTEPAGAQRLAVLNVGDSRVYVMRAGRLRRVSRDHSYVQELVDTGHITEQEARTHPRRNIVTRALGIEPSVRVDNWVVPIVRGDRFVLCSDGLVDEVDDEEIAAILAVHPSPQGAADELVATANRNGGRDNVTVVVVDLLEGQEPPPDSADLEIDLSWGEEPPDRLIDAEAGTDGDDSDLPSDGAEPRSGDTAVLPVITAEQGAPRRRITPGVFLFGLAIAAILTLTITLVLVVRNNGSDTPVVTTTSEPSTTTTVRHSTTTTVRSSTTSTSSTAPTGG
jgi:protein phosphatase